MKSYTAMTVNQPTVNQPTVNRPTNHPARQPTSRHAHLALLTLNPGPTHPPTHPLRTHTAESMPLQPGATSHLRRRMDVWNALAWLSFLFFGTGGS